MGEWFGGQVSLEERMIGLDCLEGDTILDLGCAEGLISHSLIIRGAKVAHGFDKSLDRVNRGNATTSDSVTLYQADLNSPPVPPLKRYDIVLVLAILQKLEHPEDLLIYAMRHAKDWLAIRTPAKVLCDRRSNFRRLDTAKFVTAEGFRLVCEIRSPVWVGVFRRDY